MAKLNADNCISASLMGSYRVYALSTDWNSFFAQQK